MDADDEEEDGLGGDDLVPHWFITPRILDDQVVKFVINRAERTSVSLFIISCVWSSLDRSEFSSASGSHLYPKCMNGHTKGVYIYIYTKIRMRFFLT